MAGNHSSFKKFTEIFFFSTDVLFISLFMRKEIDVGNSTCSSLSRIFKELLWPEAGFFMCVYKDKCTSLCRVTFCLVYDFSALRAVTPMATPDSQERGIATQT